LSNVSAGIGAQLAVGATSIGNITKLGNPTLKRDMIDITTLSSLNGAKQYMPGLLDPGTMTMEGFFDTSDSGQSLLFAKLASGSLDTYTMTFPSVVGASWTASCYIKELALGDQVDTTKGIPFKATLQVTGLPSLATAVCAGISALTLTGASGTLSPAFANGVYNYAWEFITTTSITVTPTAAAQQYTMYVDGVNQGTVNGGSVSAAIPFATAGTSHKIHLIVSEAGYSPLIYTIIAVRTA